MFDFITNIKTTNKDNVSVKKYWCACEKMVETSPVPYGTARLLWVNRLVYEVKNKAFKSIPVKREFSNLSYIFSLFEKLRYAVKKFNISMVAKAARKLKDLIHSKIDLIPNDEIAGIYIIPLLTETQEEKLYIGMTGLKFKDRLKENLNDIMFNRQTTALARQPTGKFKYLF